MFQKTCLGLAEARAAVEAVLEEANKLPDAPIAVAVVDDYGRLVYFARMDGCPPVVVELAINKAYTAAVALMDTWPSPNGTRAGAESWRPTATPGSPTSREGW